MTAGMTVVAPARHGMLLVPRREKRFLRSHGRAEEHDGVELFPCVAWTAARTSSCCLQNKTGDILTGSTSAGCMMISFADRI